MTPPKKLNGHKKPDAFAQACPRDDVSAPTGKVEVWKAYDKRTGAYLGPIRAESHHAAHPAAADLYNVPAEFVAIPPRGKVA